MNPFELLHPLLRNHITEDLKWKDLSDIQKEAIPIIMSGEDCILEAPTSGGKTEAVLFPTLTNAAFNKTPGIRILYLAPLKALLNDIEIRAKRYSEKCGLKSFKWHGDVSQSQKINQIISPSELLLTTPESLEAILLRKSNWIELFSSLQTIIIDEAHSFALGERGSHLVCLLERLENELECKPQRIALTATVGNPEEMLLWLAGQKRSPGKRIHVKRKTEKEKDFKVHLFDWENDSEENPEEHSYIRFNEVLYNLLPGQRSIIFANSRSNTEEIATQINQINFESTSRNPVKVRTHHSAVSKYFREEAEEMIKRKKEEGINAIISTSTLELGIDIGELNKVIQLYSLSSSSSFLQRVGRTGRRDDKPQYFRGLCYDKNDLLLMSACVNLGLKGVSEAILFPTKNYSILAHQIICLTLQKMGIEIEEAWDILKNAYCFKNISEEMYRKLVSNMMKEDYLRESENELIISARTEKEFLWGNWKRLFAVFDSGPIYSVVEGKKHIGMLDPSFVKNLQLPFIFVLGGIEWEALKINHESQQVSVKKSDKGHIPKWDVRGTFDVPFETAQEAGRILMNNQQLDFLEPEARIGIDCLREENKGIKWDEDSWIIEKADSQNIILWTFSGDKINRVISKLIEINNIGETKGNYLNVKIKSRDREDKNLTKKLLSYFNIMKLKGTNEIYKTLIQNLENNSYSKFSKCVPSNLTIEELIDKTMAVEYLHKYLTHSNFKFSYV